MQICNMQITQIGDGLRMTSLFLNVKLGMVVPCLWSPNTLKAEAGGLP